MESLRAICHAIEGASVFTKGEKRDRKAGREYLKKRFLKKVTEIRACVVCAHV